MTQLDLLKLEGYMQHIVVSKMEKKPRKVCKALEKAKNEMVKLQYHYRELFGEKEIRK